MLQRSLVPKVKQLNRIRRKMLTLSVDGNISSGKSTLVSRLVEFFPKNNSSSIPTGNGITSTPATTPLTTGGTKFKIEVIPEPLEKWCNLDGHNLLEMFYRSPENNNFLFQHYVQLTRLMDTVRRDPEDLLENSGPTPSLKIRVMERSLQNNRYCFLELGKKSGKLHAAEFAVLAEWYSWLERNMDLKLDLIIYLRTKPETAFARMKARARAAEDSCPFQYLSDLHESYEDWLIRKNKDKDENTVNQHVIVLDADKSKEEVSAQCFALLQEYLKQLMQNQIQV